MGDGTEIDPDANLAGPLVIGRNCRIAKGAGCFEYSFIGDNCIIEEDARIHRSVIWADSFVGKSAEIGGTLVGQHGIIKISSLVMRVSSSVTGAESVRARPCNLRSRSGLIRLSNPGLV